MKPERERRKELLSRIFAIAVVATTVGSVVGWSYTVRELNALVAYKPVGAEALRAAEAKHGVRLPHLATRQKDGLFVERRHAATLLSPAAHQID